MADATAAASTSSSASTAAPPVGFLLRVLLVMGSWTALHLGIVGALSVALVPGGWWTIAGVFVALLAAILVFLSSFREDAHPGAAVRVLVMRPFWYAQVALLPMSLVGGLGAIGGLPFGRALAWGQAGAFGAGALVLALAAVGYWGSRRLVVRDVSFAFPDLPAGFDGLRIVQLSDLHVGPHTPRRFLARIVREVEAARPDLVVYTGDQVDDHDKDVVRFGEVFGSVRAPLGAFAIAGNHDVYAGWSGVRRGLEGAGIRVLVNDAVPLRRGADELWLAGTGDPAGRPGSEAAPDVGRTLAAVPAGAFTVVLAHNPALFPALARRGAHLTLSGHTHHGQISIPALGWCLASPFLTYAMGAYALGRSRLYVSPGTNYWGLPLRVGAWPEVTVVTLRRGV